MAFWLDVYGLCLEFEGVWCQRLLATGKLEFNCFCIQKSACRGSEGASKQGSSQRNHTTKTYTGNFQRKYSKDAPMGGHLGEAAKGSIWRPDCRRASESNSQLRVRKPSFLTAHLGKKNRKQISKQHRLNTWSSSKHLLRGTKS